MLLVRRFLSNGTLSLIQLGSSEQLFDPGGVTIFDAKLL